MLANAWGRPLTQMTKTKRSELEADWVASATQLARRIISIFNQPEPQQIVRVQGPNAPYWRQVLDYCVDGGLPAVVDEFTHLLVDQVGLNGTAKERILEGLTQVAAESTGLRVSSVGVYEYGRGETAHAVSTQSLRLHFTARIGQEKEDEKGVERAINVRKVFNSPFWPFVLVSTSIGQEGLDFHLYCHAIGHWNLPTNPVDLEQREGRVHRYMGHAVRKNVATVYGDDGRIVEDGDAWRSAFELARRDRPVGATDLVPYWVYPSRAERRSSGTRSRCR